MHWISADILEITSMGLRFQPHEALVIDSKGVICDRGPMDSMKKAYPQVKGTTYEGRVLIPPFFDAHLHFPQLTMIGQAGGGLLKWLNEHTFPTEMAYEDEGFAKQKAKEFCEELLKHGIGGAAIFSSSHQKATCHLIAELTARGIKGIVGRSSMDRHAPKELLVAKDRERDYLVELIEKHHGDNLIRIALTPRYAPSVSEELFGLLKELKERYPSLYIQTHLSETKEEVAWVKELFPSSKDYLAVYETYGLVGPTSLFGHGIHLNAREVKGLVEKKAKLVHCPSSNLFLGSGLFSYKKLQEAGVSILLGSDIGAGTSLNPWHTIASAYQISQLKGEPVSLSELFRAATAASEVGFQDTGSLEKGFFADFQIIDPKRTKLSQLHWEKASSAEDRLATLVFHADDRHLEQLYLKGQAIF